MSGGDGGYWGGLESGFGRMPRGPAGPRPTPYARSSASTWLHTGPPTPPVAPPPVAVEMKVTAKSKSQEAEIAWVPPESLKSTDFDLAVTISGGNTTNNVTLPAWRNSMRLRVQPGTWYKVAVSAVRKPDGAEVAKGTAEFKSVFDREELLMLYNKCVQFSGSKLERFSVFYRHKPKEYWDNIAYNRNHVMEKYIKDLNGQAASPINDVIYGLFFSANLVHGKLPLSSPFGDIRMVLSPPKLFTPKHKLYFADFYCNYIIHYMTVVVCIAGSETDRYCSKALVPLDPMNNPFLKIDKVGEDLYEYWVNAGIWVETYYTENVPTDWAHEWGMAQMRGKSKPGGLAQNRDCKVCNLYHEENEESMRQRDAALRSIRQREEEREKRRREEDSKKVEEIEIEDEEEAASTFHLVMEMEREAETKKGKDSTDVPPNLEALDLILELVDSVVAEVGPRIPIPAHGMVGKNRGSYRGGSSKDSADIVEVLLSDDEDDGIQPLTQTKVREEKGDDEDFLPKAEEMKSAAGKELLATLVDTNRRLNAKFKTLGTMISAIQESIALLERKTKGLPSIP